MSDNSNISSELGKTTSTAPSVLVQEGGYQLAPISFYPLAGLVLSDGSIDWQAADQSDDPVDTITITKTAGSGTFSTTRILHDSNIASDVTVSSDGNTITYVGSLSNFTKYFEQELGYGVYAQVPETDDFTVSISNSYGTASATTSIVIDSNIDAAQAFISTQPSFSVSDTAGLASSIGGLYRLTTSNLGTSGLSTTQTATLTLSIDTVTAGVGGTLEAISLPSDATVSGNGTTTIAVTGTEAELATILQNDIYFVGNSGSTLLKTDEAQIQTTLTLQETGSSVVQSIGQTLMEYGTLLPFSMAVSAVSPTGSSSASGGSYGLTQSNATYALFPSSTYGVTFTNATGEVSVSLVNSNTAAGTLDLSAASNTGLVGSVSNTTDGTAQTVTATFDNATDATAFLDTAVFDIAQGSAAEGQVTTVTLDASNVSSGVTATAFSENLTVIPTTAPALSGLPASSDPSDAANTPFASAVVTSPGDLPVTVTVTVADAAGTLSSGTASDLTVSGSGSGTLTLKGDVADVQAALRAVTFTATAGLETAETVSFSTSVTNGYTSSTATASTIVEPGLSFSAPATADSLSALLQGVNLSDASATSVTLTVQETSGSGTLSVAADSALNATVSTDGKTVTVTGTVAELTAELASGAITATDPSVMVDSESGNATFSLTASDGSTTVSASSTVSVAGSATFLTSGNTITTSNNADVSVALTNTAAGTFINAGASTLTLKNDNAGSNGTTVTMSGNGIVDATETGTSGDSFIMGADGGSNTLNIANTGSGSTTVTADGKTQTVNAADSTSQVVVFGSASQVNYTGGTGLLVSNGAGNTTDWTITGVSGGSNQVWLGNSDVTINAGGANQVILGNGAGLNGSVSITGGSSSDTEEVDLWNEAGTTGTVTQTGSSSLSVFGSEAGSGDITLSNGNVALSSGTNTVTAQDQGTVAVSMSGGDTTFTDAGTGDAAFYATGSGSFSVTDTGASTGTLTIGILSSASSSLSWNAATGTRQATISAAAGTGSVTTGSGVVSAMQAGNAALTFLMGQSGANSTLDLTAQGANMATIDTSGNTQTIDTTGSTAAVVVFGGASAVSYTGGTGILVSNSSDDTTDWTITGVSGGSNQVWLGNSDVTINAGGANQVILGNGAGLNGSVSITGGSSSDTEEVDLWNEAGTTGTVTQTGSSSLSVFGSEAGSGDITLSNGNVALSSGTNTVTAQDQGTVAVSMSGGDTSFTDAGTGDAAFYATGTGTFSVTDTGASTGTLTIGVLSSASSSLSWNAATGTRQATISAAAGTGSVTTGSGVVSAMQAGNAALTFLMGQSGANSTLDLTAQGANMATIDTSGNTQTIDTTGSTAAVVVFGGASAVSYTGGTGILVSNSSDDTTDWTITGVSGGSNQVWLGNSDVTINAGGANQVILGNGAGLNGSVSITGGSSSDTEEVDLWNEAGTTGTVTQTGSSSLSVFGSEAGSGDITLSNGNVALSSGTNTVTAQDQGTVAVSMSGGDTSFTDAGTGDAAFYATGTGTFSVTDTGSGNAILSIMQLASSTASGTVVGGAKQLDVTTGGGDMTVTAGAGGLDLSTAGAGALTLDITNGTDHVAINSGNTGDVTVSGGAVNSNAYFSVTGVASEGIVNGSMVVNLTDGHTVTFVGDASSSNITLNLV